MDIVNKSKSKEKFIVGLAPGNYKNARKAMNVTIECVNFLKRHTDLPIVVGCSSPIITQKSSEIADGILFNYVKVEFINWISSFAKKEVFFAAYGPSLILPSNFFEDLLIASAIVISSETFVKKFGFEKLFEEIKQVNFQELIRVRQEGKSVKSIKDFGILVKHSKTLLENFTISGSINNVIKKINDLLKVCNHVILSDPFFRDINSMNSLKRIVKSVDN